jgi:hypothetical protein
MDQEAPKRWFNDGNNFRERSGGGSSRKRGRVEEWLGGEGWSEPGR